MMDEETPTVGVTVRARITPTPARRFLAYVMLYALGGLLLYLAFVSPPSGIGLQVFLIALGVGALYLGEKVRRATVQSLELTDDGIYELGGRQLCRLDDITGIDRGAFAFKPSHGFLLRLSRPGPAAWAPGLWWRVGRRIGVGGVTPQAEAKVMAELIAVHIASRTGR